MKVLWRGRVRALLTAACTLVGASGTWAECAREPGVAERFVNMDMGTVLIPRDTPVGAVIASRAFPISANGPTEVLLRCTTPGTAHGVMLMGSPVPGYPDVYTTDVPGVGIRLSRRISADITVYYPHTFPLSIGTHYFDLGTQFQVELIKTADVTGNGPLAHGIYTRYYADDGPAFSTLTTQLSGVGITIITPSCELDDPSLTVPLGNVPRSTFRGLNSPADGYSKSFNIRLNCSAGSPTQNTVFLRMDAQPDPSNRQGVLRLSQGTDAAGGVGIEVLDGNGTPVQFGENALVGPSKDGFYTLPYTARYVQTGNQVTPGRADGTATLTIEYK